MAYKLLTCSKGIIFNEMMLQNLEKKRIRMTNSYVHIKYVSL